MKVVQCWDDGISADIPLIEILKKYKAKASFNLNAGLHEKKRSNGWKHKGTDVIRLGIDELVDVYEGFTIANHSLTHPSLEKLSVDQARMEIRDNRKKLQDIFTAPIDGFAYPFGTYNQAVMDIIKEEGHVYARTTKNVTPCFPPENPMAFHCCCHFLSEDFWQHYENSKECGVFYFWGHSYEIISSEMLATFEAHVQRIDQDPDSEWAEILDLF